MKYTHILSPVLITVFLSLDATSGTLIDEAREIQAERREMIRKSNNSSPRKHLNDKYREERILKEESFHSVCGGKKFKSFYERHDCAKKAGEEYRKNYPDRGTHEYGEKFYAGLTKQQGIAKRKELLNLLNKVSFYPKPGNEDTELTVEHLRQEIYYIERYVIKVAPRRY